MEKYEQRQDQTWPHSIQNNNKNKNIKYNTDKITKKPSTIQ